MGTDQNKDILDEFERLQLLVTQFSVVEQRLIDTRFRLDQEVMRFGRMQEFNDLALSSSLGPAFANLVAESLINLFEVEVGIFYLGAEKSLENNICQIAGSKVSGTEVETLCNIILKNIPHRPHTITAQVMPRNVLESVQNILPLDNSLVVIIHDENPHQPTLFVAGNTVPGAPFREKLSLGHREALGLFAQQVVVHVKSLRDQKAIFDAMQEGFAVHEIILDDAGNPVNFRFLTGNPALSRIFKIESEIIGKTAAEVTPGLTEEPWLTRLGAVVQTGEPDSFEEFDTTLNSWLRVNVFSNSPGQFSALFEDVTERKRNEEAAQTTQKLESLGILAGGIAHDFNNMLTGIMGNSSLLLDDHQGATESVKLLAEIREACHNAKGLTHQLLTFASGGEPVLQKTNVPVVVRQATTFAARGSQVKCCIKSAEDQLFAEIDKGQIAQVLQNLVINGIQAMPSGGTITATVERQNLKEADIPLLAAGPYLRVSIRDQGPGISEALIPKIFLPYFTTKADGQGLGLSVCHSIITKHGGAIEVKPTPGQGSEFTFYLPEVAQPQPNLVPDARRPRFADKRVLVMDDDKTITILLSRMLGRLGCLVTAVPDGETALTTWKEAEAAGEYFDLLIMDLTIQGGMGGKETIKHIAKLDPDVKAIVSSGYANTRVLADYESHGFIGILAKPYGLKELKAIMCEVFDDYQSDSALA